MMRIRSAWMLVVILSAATPVIAASQGVSDASLRGRVVNDAGQPIANARVQLTNTDVGSVRTQNADDHGSFHFAHVPVGSRYALEARAIGYAPASIADLAVHAGDHVVRELVMSAQARRLDDIIVRGSALRDGGSGGPVHAIPASAVQSLPLLNRNVFGLFGTAAQATGATDLSISGQHSRFNLIQIDGGSASDPFGVNLTAGANVGTKAISLEAVQEVRILIAPFDVREGGFSGGVINAITRSGTNDIHASSFMSVGRWDLVGKDTAFASVDRFEMLQYGMSVGGPIVRDRIHFFIAGELQSKQTPFAGFSTSEPTTGITEQTAQRAAQIFRDQYGFEAGGPAAPVLQQPNRNVFTKLSFQINSAHLLTLSSTWADATTDGFNRSARTQPNRDGWQLSNSGFVSRDVTSLSRIKLTSVSSRLSNDVSAGVQTSHDAVRSNNRVPLFLVLADDQKSYIAGGSVLNGQDTFTDEHIVDITDNVTVNLGAHELTTGMQGQVLHVRDRLFQGSWGIWTFRTVDALERREPIRYEVSRAIRAGGPLADYTSTMMSGYVQDRWRATPRLILTAGLRADVPFQDTPPRNDALAADAALGNIDTGIFPSGNGILSPRVGFSYVLGDRQELMIRGGMGGFAGTPPSAWLKNAFANTGQEQSKLTCNSADGVPAPTTDINNLPTHCLLRASPGTDVPTVAYFSDHFKFQQARKFALGFDRDFGHGASVSLDIVHTRTTNTAFVRDTNLVEAGSNAEGRVMYGRIVGTTTAVPARRDSLYGPVYRFDNISADRSTSISGVINKRWDNGGAIEASYNWSRSTDVMSMAGFTGQVIMQNNPIDGSQDNRHSARSSRDIPHTFVMTGLLPEAFGLTASFFLRARSGTPYSYVAGGDANADGFVGNDLLYVPRNASDISLSKPEAYQTLDTFIESKSCLRDQRGRVMARNSCRNPSVTRLDARLAKPVSVGGRRTIEITADIFDLPNLINRDWGVVRETTNKETAALLPLAGWDSAANRPQYSVPALLPTQSPVLADASRWTMQLGARYRF